LWILALSGIVAMAVLAGWLIAARDARRDVPLTAVPLTSYAGQEVAASFSPDSNQVAFVWNGEKQDDFATYVRLIGSDWPLRITSNPAPDFSPAWSPDGRSTAFLRRGR
jgi:Tol biopolymer transport system component